MECEQVNFKTISWLYGNITALYMFPQQNSLRIDLFCLNAVTRTISEAFCTVWMTNCSSCNIIWVWFPPTPSASKRHTVCVVLIPINPSSVQTQLFIFSAMPKGGKTEETLAVNYVRRDELWASLLLDHWACALVFKTWFN